MTPDMKKGNVKVVILHSLVIASNLWQHSAFTEHMQKGKEKEKSFLYGDSCYELVPRKGNEEYDMLRCDIQCPSRKVDVTVKARMR